MVLASLLLALGASAAPVCATRPLDAPKISGLTESACETDIRYALDELEKKCGSFFALKKIDWPAVSKQFLADAKAVKSDAEHLLLLMRLLARLKDGHSEVRPLEKGKSIKLAEDRSAWTGPGMFLCRIGKKIYVKNAFGDAAGVGLKPGMEILSIDDVPVAKWLDERIAELSDTISFSTAQQAFFYACHWGLARAPGTRIELSLKDAKGAAKKRTITYAKSSLVPDGPAFFPKDLASTKDLNFGKTARGFAYVHVRRSPENLPEQLDEALAKVGDAPGMILDFRGNSGGGMDHEAFMGRFVPSGKSMSFTNTYKSAGAKPYGGPIVAIVDANVRSTGETASGIFKEDGRAYMIGESPTAGMSSQKTTIDLPSGLFALYVSTASNKGRFNAGRGIEGIGVIPHEIVEFDPKDLAEEVDTLIARAEALLERFPQAKVPHKPEDFGWKKPPAGKSK